MKRPTCCNIILRPRIDGGLAPRISAPRSNPAVTLTGGEVLVRPGHEARPLQGGTAPTVQARTAGTTSSEVPGATESRR